MAETDHKTPSSVPPPPPPSSSSGVPTDMSKGHSTSNNHGANDKLSGHRNYYNPPETANPDAATLRDQWRYAIRQYSKWYSHAWGTAILAGVAFFALGWVIKGENPLPSFHSQDHPSPPPSSSDAEKPRP